MVLSRVHSACLCQDPTVYFILLNPYPLVGPPPLRLAASVLWFCEKRRGEQLKWSLAFRLYIGSFVFHVHSYQDQFIQPGWAECVLYLA